MLQLDWNQLNTILMNVPTTTQRLEVQFKNFSTKISKLVLAPDFQIKDISAQLDANEKALYIGFAGRNLTFAFDTFFEEGQSFRGRVKCYLMPNLAHEEVQLIDTFTFNVNGTSSLHYPNAPEAKLSLGDDFDALNILFHIIYKSLSY